ncbi:MAG TPA: hypothetical protein VFX16_01940 [Pseudonocardiaceae bacterium]|nr:hypothetical protein [Pseudonocardiaceae bacterium]
MRKIVPLLGALIATLTFCLVPVGSASAFGAEQLECRIVSGPIVPAFAPGECFPNNPAGSYSVSFEVFNGTGSYTYTWTVPSGFSGYAGCGSTDPGCAFSVGATRADKLINASVVVHQGGSSETLTAQADVPATCPFPPNFAFC